MATDLKSDYQTIEQQFVDLFYAKYMAEQWGIEMGYNTIPDTMATMRMNLVLWQLGMDCSNSLCLLSRSQSVTVDNMASGVDTHNHNNPCCNDNATFKPL